MDDFRTFISDIEQRDDVTSQYVMGWVDELVTQNEFIMSDYSGSLLVKMPESKKVIVDKGFVLQVTIVTSGTFKMTQITTDRNLLSVIAEDVTIVNTSKENSKDMLVEKNVDDFKYKFRYLHLRREEMKRNLILRHQIASEVRNFLNYHRFIEIETPILYKEVPIGTPNFLVLSSLQSDAYYALPKSPQTWKQLLMTAGFERYYQFAKCFRNGERSADHLLEFTQLDLELSFVEETQIQALAEDLVRVMWHIAGYRLNAPFDYMTYEDALKRYGTDKPDRRWGLEIRTVSIEDTTEGIRKYHVLLIEDATRLTKTDRLRLIEAISEQSDIAFSLEIGSTGSPTSLEVHPYHTSTYEQSIAKLLGLTRGQLALVATGSENTIRGCLLHLINIMKETKMVTPNREWDFVWITKIPLFEERDGRIRAKHHPFTKPVDEDIELLNTDPLKVTAHSYDLVCNGHEVAGGSLRIIDRSQQLKILRIIGLDENTARGILGFLLESLEFGAPPHGGIAFGFDRIVALLARTSDIRDVIAFPLAPDGTDKMTGAPVIQHARSWG